MSFTAPEGKITAIVGPSGGGKSTIAHLIPQFWDVQSSSISIGNVDIRNLSEETLMGQVSFVFQDVYLFGQSILENIRMGHPDATEDEAIQAAKAAMCHEFISRLPKGYDTVFGEEGVHLSGGEAQRISIARAILQDTPILVLDEAIASLDPENEVFVQQAINRLVDGKTVLVIAHRLRTIAGADYIVVLENGRVAEHGTHEELMSHRGLYEHLYSLQMENAVWELT